MATFVPPPGKGAPSAVPGKDPQPIPGFYVPPKKSITKLDPYAPGKNQIVKVTDAADDDEDES